MNTDGSNKTKLSNHPAFDALPLRSPDEARITFVSSRDGAHEIYVINADSSGEMRLTNSPPNTLNIKSDWQPLQTITVAFDIKPNSDPNTINLCSGGAVPVAILGSDTFNANDINTDTLRFAEAAVKVVDKKDPHTLCSLEDVNDDGYCPY